ncbi:MULTISPECIES: biotin/lipoate A/B protein ligase family protein [unclassified Corynebacterium]|uniref:lipoate--protein ligase family protein n=1 Tax=unclassified Corynebacterium TaxID=2624378 RepID=UPI00264CD8F3|nr:MULTISPECIES: biotin/lipoate A/B protein ligase family protein [unclassified Corynebacterium]MDN8595203.1 biotin/lipoate A/B protein ligase family protein [Corynebacterium sp. P4_F2]WKK55331.1 biotin/lipoate A/B protein ligase family protein [Corynebacterium sp. P4-C1]WKK62740.1 biotin/lipoate A/B protein ligase family protein [Corynebacterium sp. P8-C1]
MASHHFEVKVSGGKLVVADLTDDGTEITDAKISGDFFLEPEEAYDAINGALVGASVTESADDLQKRIDDALAALDGGQPVALHGFSTRDVAVTARRALLDAKDLTDYNWTVIHSPVLPTPVNVALDQYLLEEVAAGRKGPILRFWEWEDKAVVFGSYQSFQNELDPEGIAKHGIVPVRRMSGGGAMFMEGGNCVTYSMYVPDDVVAGLSYVDSYQYLDTWVLAGLQSLGVNAWYVPINDITSDGGKIGGAAQKRVNGAILHHTTMSYDINADKMMEVLRVGKVKLADKGVRSAKKRVDPLRRQTGVARQEVIEALMNTFISRYPAETGQLSDDDIAAAEKLVEEKFGTEAWTHRVP